MKGRERCVNFFYNEGVLFPGNDGLKSLLFMAALIIN